MTWGISLIRSDLGLWHFEKRERDSMKKDMLEPGTGQELSESRKEGKDD